MAYIEKATTQRTKDGKPQPTYRVRWMETTRDEMGRPIPIYPHRPDGQKKQHHRQESFRSKEAAQERCDELNAARHRTSAQSASEIRKAGDQPFGVYAGEWLDSMAVKVARGQLKERTHDDYEKLLHRYVLQRFGGQAIATITPRQCESFLAELVHKGLSPKTAKHAWSVFNRVLTYGMRHGAIPSNPADQVEFGGGHAVGDREKFEHHPLTAEQIGALAAAIGERYPVYELATLFFAYTGVRSAEAAGLEVRDLAFTTGPANADGSQTTRCAVSVRRTKDRKAGEWITSTPKSKRSRRTVPLPPWLAERMHDYLANEHPRSDEPNAPLWPSRTTGGSRTKGEKAIAPLDWSQPVAFSTFYETIFRPALVSVGLPVSNPEVPATKNAPAIPATRGVRLHDLRHTFATMQLMAGVHFLQVSRWLGHGQPSLTLDVYGDWIPAEDGGAGNNLPAPTAPSTSVPAQAVPSNVVHMFGRKSAG